MEQKTIQCGWYLPSDTLMVDINNAILTLDCFVILSCYSCSCHALFSPTFMVPVSQKTAFSTQKYVFAYTFEHERMRDKACLIASYCFSYLNLKMRKANKVVFSYIPDVALLRVKSNLLSPSGLNQRKFAVGQGCGGPL